MRIGTLAKEAGVPTSTVRFYERAGLLAAEGRSAGNYREYGAQSLEKLRLIRSAQAVGLSMRDVSELLELTYANGSVCRDVEQLMQRRLDGIRQRMKDLRRLERTLTKAIATCCKGEDPGICERVHKLKK